VYKRFPGAPETVEILLLGKLILVEAQPKISDVIVKHHSVTSNFLRTPILQLQYEQFTLLEIVILRVVLVPGCCTNLPVGTDFDRRLSTNLSHLLFTDTH
jgi:hypothetical protein